MRSLLLAAALMAGTWTATAAPMSPFDGATSAGTMAVPVQSRSCRACRNACSWERRYCGYSMSCRRDFTLCMRACWEDVCR